jgi:hypothetical protein
VDLVFLHGPPAAGKLTVGRELARLTGFALFHNHLMVDALTPVFEFGSRPFVELREELWLRVLDEAAGADRSVIFTFAPERTVRATFAPALESLVRAHAGRVWFVELRCDDDELERRIADPSRRGSGKLHSVALFRELRDDGAFRYQGLPVPHLSIDTTRVAPGDAAHRIVERFRLPMVAS